MTSLRDLFWPIAFFVLLAGSGCQNEESESKSAKDAFAAIYKNGEWGKDTDGNGISGSGSIPENVKPYLNFLQQFLRNRSIMSVVDIGCGDWALHRHIDFGHAKYSGFDVFEELIEKNRKRFGNDRIEFHARDAINETIPRAELLIVKDVLQHWPSSEIIKFLPKTAGFKYALITNDIDIIDSSKNNSEIAGFGGWRPLDLGKHPFNLQGTTILEFQAANHFKRVLLIDNSNTWIP